MTVRRELAFRCRCRSMVSQPAAPRRAVVSEMQGIAATGNVTYSNICEHPKQRIATQFARMRGMNQSFPGTALLKILNYTRFN